MSKNILWWGKGNPKYSRNGVVRTLLIEAGHKITDFCPKFPFKRATKSLMQDIDIIWVPCFRQRDIISAKRAAQKYKIPLIFDPLISAYDKQVFERQKFPENSYRAKHLLKKETKQFQMADMIVADTIAHAEYFEKQFHLDSNKISVLSVGAEEQLFFPKNKSPSDKLTEVLFYGSFINLQGPEFIVKAANLCRDQSIQWTLLGNGPLLDSCKQLASNNPNIRFEDWTEYANLANRIHEADILLGIFGSSNKAARVIPNKVYQALACGKPIITMRSNAYPEELVQSQDCGIRWTNPGDPQDLTRQVTTLAREDLKEIGQQAYQSYLQYFSMRKIREQLNTIIQKVSQNLS